MSDALAELFSSKMRAAVLRDLLPRPHLAFGLTELSQRLGLPISSLQHECAKLTRLGVLIAARQGASRRYRANPAYALLAPLTSLVLRNLGLPEALGAAAEGVEDLELAFVAPSSGPTRPATLVIVGRLDLEQLDALVQRVNLVFSAHESLPPELAFFPPAEWRTRQANGNVFAQRLLAGPILALAGVANPESEPAIPASD